VTTNAGARVILVADDDWMNREVMQTFLESAGYHVIPAISGSQALQLTYARRPDLVMLDVRMNGLDGYEVCEHLKSDESLHSLKVVLVTAMEREEDMARAAAVHADDFLPKSLDWMTIMARVGQLLE
jgi:CheY-like chemotaxis protein